MNGEYKQGVRIFEKLTGGEFQYGRILGNLLNKLFMKTLRLFLSLSLLAISSSAFSYQIPAKQTAICWFYIGVEDDLHLSMGLSPETMLSIAMQREDATAKELLTNSLKVISENVNSKTGIKLLPIETLEGAVQYSRMGFPLVSLKKASKKGNQPQYVRIDILVSAAKTTTRTTSVGAAEIEGEVLTNDASVARFYPQVTVTLKFADASGKVIDKAVGKYRHNEKAILTAESLSIAGWTFTYDQDAQPIPYYFFLEKAVEDLVSKLK